MLSFPTLWDVSYTKASALSSFPLPELICLLDLREWSVYKLSCFGAFSSSSFSLVLWPYIRVLVSRIVLRLSSLFSLSLWDYIFHLKKKIFITILVWLYEGNLPSLIRSLHACKLNCFSHVRLVGTPWTVVHQAPLSMGFSRQEYWNGLPFPSPVRSLVSFNSYIKSCFSNDSIRAQRLTDVPRLLLTGATKT